jgi:H+-translocating NAD(P) transhydrogenase subunit beta
VTTASLSLGPLAHPVTALSMPLSTWRDLVYLIAIIGFIVAMKGLSSPKRARQGNLVGAASAVLAVAITFTNPVVHHAGKNLALALVAMVLGAAIAVPAARLVKMTAMPQMVAIFNGVGGGAASVISVVELLHWQSLGTKPAVYQIAEVLLGVLIGTVSFSGSAIAFAKLQELMATRPITYPAQQVINAIVALAIVVLVILALVTGSIVYVWPILALAFVLGVIFVLPIGGADVPVLISLLNSFTGLAVAASGFTLDNNLLIVAGTLVGASGILLTRLMSKAMGRSLPNVLFSAFGSVVTATGGAEGDTDRSVRSSTPDDVGTLLAYARKVVIVPGYGLAVAQAQHVVKELVDSLMARGVDVFYAIHPVAGRMPGHMNVLLAEANVPYDELKEMDEANPEMSTADVALVVGANDTVNPAANDTPGSPIYGMPIIHADQAQHVVFLKRSMRPGFAGIDNELLFDDKTVLLFGDAKDTLQKLVTAVAQA